MVMWLGSTCMCNLNDGSVRPSGGCGVFWTWPLLFSKNNLRKCCKVAESSHLPEGDILSQEDRLDATLKAPLGS